MQSRCFLDGFSGQILPGQVLISISITCFPDLDVLSLQSRAETQMSQRQEISLKAEAKSGPTTKRCLSGKPGCLGLAAAPGC